MCCALDVPTFGSVFFTPVLVILAGLVITASGIGVGWRLSRRPRSIDHEGPRDNAGGFVCGVVVLVGAVTVVLGIADGLFILVTGA